MKRSTIRFVCVGMNLPFLAWNLFLAHQNLTRGHPWLSLVNGLAAGASFIAAMYIGFDGILWGKR